MEEGWCRWESAKQGRQWLAASDAQEEVKEAIIILAKD